MKKEEPTLKMYKKSDPVYNNKFIFYEYYDSEKFHILFSNQRIRFYSNFLVI